MHGNGVTHHQRFGVSFRRRRGPRRGQHGDAADQWPQPCARNTAKHGEHRVGLDRRLWNKWGKLVPAVPLSKADRARYHQYLPRRLTLYRRRKLGYQAGRDASRYRRI
jgi:hypothetical protein